MKLYKRDQYIYYRNVNGKVNDEFLVGNGRVNFETVPGVNSGDPDEVYITVYREEGYTTIRVVVARVVISDIVDRYDEPYGDTLEELNLNFNKGVNVNVLDVTSDLIIEKFNQIQESTFLTVAAAINTRTLTLDNITGATAGKEIILFHPTSKRFSSFIQIGSPVGNVITVDNLIDFDYPIGTFVDISITNMAVDGGTTPQVFGLRGAGIAPPGVNIDFHFNRIIITCFTSTSVSLAEFGDLAPLLYGLMLRTRNDKYHNIFNVKTNGEIAGILFDWTPYDANNLQQGQNGFVCRLTFNSKGKVGGTIPLPIGYDAELIIQDTLTDLILLEAVAEGPILDPYLKI